MNKFLFFLVVIMAACTIAMGVCSLRSNIDTQKTQIIKKTNPLYNVSYRHIYKDLGPINGFTRAYFTKRGVGYGMAFYCELNFIQFQGRH